MPRTTQTYDLREEYNRIDNELDELADEVAALGEGSPMYQPKLEEAATLERQLAGLEWALTDPDDDTEDDPAVTVEGDHDDRPYEEVTVGSLSAGEYAEVRDTLDGDDDPSMGRAGSSEILFAAMGLVDAPFIDEDDDFTAKIRTVADDLPPHFHKWLRSRVDDISTPDIEGNGFAQRLAEREASAKTQS